MTLVTLSINSATNSATERGVVRPQPLLQGLEQTVTCRREGIRREGSDPEKARKLVKEVTAILGERYHPKWQPQRKEKGREGGQTSAMSEQSH